MRKMNNFSFRSNKKGGGKRRKSYLKKEPSNQNEIEYSPLRDYFRKQKPDSLSSRKNTGSTLPLIKNHPQESAFSSLRPAPSTRISNQSSIHLKNKHSQAISKYPKITPNRSLNQSNSNSNSRQSHNLTLSKIGHRRRAEQARSGLSPISNQNVSNALGQSRRLEQIYSPKAYATKKFSVKINQKRGLSKPKFLHNVD